MRIDYDRVSGALYMKLREGEYDHTEDFSEVADVYLDVDREGNVLGLEALSFEDLALAVEERGGKLDVPERLIVGSVAETVNDLDTRRREVLMMRFRDGLARRNVAERLGISVAEAYRIEASALEALRLAPGMDAKAGDAYTEIVNSVFSHYRKSGAAVPRKPAAG